MTLPSEESILESLRSENQALHSQVLKNLYRECFPVIAQYIRKNSGSIDDAADVFQDAMVVFYEKVRTESFELNCSIQTYLYSVARNLWYNRLRAKKREVELNEEVHDYIAIEPQRLEVLIESEQDSLLVQLLERLGADCQRILRLYYFDRLRMKQIAPRMGFANEQVAKNKKSTCLKRLKNMLAENPNLKKHFE